MNIGNKYKASILEKKDQNKVAELAEVDEAFSNQCCALIVCAHFKILDEKKILRSWNEVTITRHLKKHLKHCITEQELQVFVVPEYPEDDEEIDDGLRSASEEVFFDLIFSSFSNKGQHYFGVEAKIVIENNFLKRKAATELAEYISEAGMKKFLNMVYKKRGCMVGYIMEGDMLAITNKINERIAMDKFFNGDASLKKRILKSITFHFESTHIGYHANPLKHLFLDFSEELM